MAHHIKLDTPSGGQHEVLRALERRHCTGDRTRSLADITRFLGPHYSTSDVNTVLTTMLGTGLVANPTGDQWGLTGTGLEEVRSHPNSRFVAA